MGNEELILQKEKQLCDLKEEYQQLKAIFDGNQLKLSVLLNSSLFCFLKVDSELRLGEKEDQLENVNKKYEQLENLYNNDRSQLCSTLDDVARLRQLNSELHVGHKVFVIQISLIQII